MKSRETIHMLAIVAVAFMLSPVSLADPPSDKGKAANSSQGSQGKQGNPDKQDKQDNKNEQDKQGKGGQPDDGNHGQRVADCNHRANERNLKGKDRQDFVEWCTDYGERYKYDDRRYTADRSCYRKADDRGLSGDFRRVYIQDCLRKQDSR